MNIQALIFDVDGTLAETEECHRKAFNQTFKEFGMDWSWGIELYRELLKTTGGKERMRRYADDIGFGDIDAIALHKRKTDLYVEMLMGGAVELRPGVADLITNARAEGLRLAIATTTSRENVDGLLTATLGKESIGWFEAICCGDEVANKKPDPAIYLLALEQLGLSAKNCLAFEDSALGLKSASRAGIQTLITPGIYTTNHDFSGAAFIMDNLKDTTTIANGELKLHNDQQSEFIGQLLLKSGK